MLLESSAESDVHAVAYKGRGNTSSSQSGKRKVSKPAEARLPGNEAGLQTQPQSDNSASSRPQLQSFSQTGLQTKPQLSSQDELQTQLGASSEAGSKTQHQSSRQAELQTHPVTKPQTTIQTDSLQQRNQQAGSQTDVELVAASAQKPDAPAGGVHPLAVTTALLVDFAHFAACVSQFQ